ncbi:MAG: SAM-dependent methyltransferase [Hyphomicrobiaceae bacterium]|nr:SAM-dependent methyltransferase [Hyphomicrobiaceae bacterium]
MTKASEHGVLPYDPDARRDTPLALKLKGRIRRDGPITVTECMRACLLDPEHGYYVRQQPFGAKGDFVTAPEISQVFGELVGLWSAVVWQQMGSPKRFNLVELGPGRGTMMRDALRAARIVPGFLDAASLILVDVAAMDSLAEDLTSFLPRDRITLAKHIRDKPSDAPIILLANEFLDTLPATQTIKAEDGLRSLNIGLNASGELHFVPGELLEPNAKRETTLKDFLLHQPIGTIAEKQAFEELAKELAQLNENGALAALFIDYGHLQTSPGDTLQAVRDHKYEHPLTSPGEADLTVQVDFQSFADAVSQAASIDQIGTPRERPPLTIDGPITQAEFLGSLGIMERASRLMSTNPHLANEIEMGVARLMAMPGMGDRFKAIGVRSAALQPLPGFPT